jgi:hypothetical protein
VISDRSRGVVLCALAAVLLFAGGFWYLRNAPVDTTDPRVPAWRESAANLLPDLPSQVSADTMVLVGDISAQRTRMVDGGSYSLSMVCLGAHGNVRVRLSSSGGDSGRAVPCAEAPASVTLTVGLAEDFYLQASAETDGSTAVFRWRLDRARGF